MSPYGLQQLAKDGYSHKLLHSSDMQNINNDNTKLAWLICARHLFSNRDFKITSNLYSCVFNQERNGQPKWISPILGLQKIRKHKA